MKKAYPLCYGKPSCSILIQQTTFRPTVLTPCVFMVTFLVKVASHTEVYFVAKIMIYFINSFLCDKMPTFVRYLIVLYG